MIKATFKESFIQRQERKRPKINKIKQRISKN